MGVSNAVTDSANANNATNQTVDKDGPPSAKDKPTASDAKDQEWADAHKLVVQGDVRVGVTSAVIGLVDLVELGQAGTSKDKLLIVRVKVHNLSKTRKVDFSGWGDAGRIFSPNPADLTDGQGNAYKRINFGFATKVVGQVENEAIYPGKTAEDLLVFEPPVDNAPFVRLELPAAAFGGTGKLRFQIPKAMIGQSPIEVDRPDPADAANDRAAEEARKAAAEEARKAAAEEALKAAAEEARKAAIADAVKSLDAMKAGDPPADAIAYLSDEDKGVHSAALSAVKRIGHPAFAALAKSLGTKGEKAEETRLRAAKTLGEIGPDAKDLLDTIRFWTMAEKNPEIKQAEINALEKITAKP